MSDDLQGARIFGVDFGGTSCAIAYLDDGGQPTVCRNQDGMETTPSVIYFETPDNVLVGESAKQAYGADGNNVASQVKSLLQITDWHASFHGKEYDAKDLAALILRQLASDAELHSGEPVQQVVIAVPAYFGTTQRSSMAEACANASLELIGTVPEPVAAAIHYGLIGPSRKNPTNDSTQDKSVLVYHLGGTTFDISILQVGTQAARVVLTNGDAHLGGSDWNDVLKSHLQSRLDKLAQPSELRYDDPKLERDLTNRAELLKKRLTTHQSGRAPLHFAGISTVIEVTRSEFEEMTEHLLDRTITLVEATLADLQTREPGTKIDEVLLVGGATKMPMIAAKLGQQFDWNPRIYEPDLAVAKGTATYTMSRLGYQVQQEAINEMEERPLLDLPPDAAIKANAQLERRARLDLGGSELDSAPEQRRYALLRAYAQQGLKQSKVSFYASLIAATLGFIVILTGAGLAILTNNVVGSAITVVAGVVIDAVSLLFFSQDRRHQRTMFDFFERLREERKLDEALQLIHHSRDGGTLNPDVYAAVILHFANVPNGAALLKSSRDGRSTRGSRTRANTSQT